MTDNGPGSAAHRFALHRARDDEDRAMPPRIRALLPRPPFAREKKAPAPEAPKVFREFVETLQRLDAVRTAAPRAEKHGAPAMRRRKRGYIGNGHRRPSRAGRSRV